VYAFFAIAYVDDSSDQPDTPDQVDWVMREVGRRFSRGLTQPGGFEVPLLEELPVIRTEQASWHGWCFDFDNSMQGLRMAIYSTLADADGHSLFFLYKAGETDDALAAIQAIIPTVVLLDPPADSLPGATLARQNTAALRAGLQ
jgi:hypothetical protein